MDSSIQNFNLTSDECCIPFLTNDFSLSNWKQIFTHHNHIAFLEEKCSANFHDYATEVERLFLHAITNNLPLTYSLFRQARENIPLFWPWTKVKFSQKDQLQQNLEILNTLEQKIHV